MGKFVDFLVFFVFAPWECAHCVRGAHSNASKSKRIFSVDFVCIVFDTLYDFTSVQLDSQLNRITHIFISFRFFFRFLEQQSPEAAFDIVVNRLDAEDSSSNKIIDNEPLTLTPLRAYLANDVTALGGTITPKPPNVELDDIFISVKTTKANHGNRLDVISKTWFQLAAKQVNCALNSICIGNLVAMVIDVLVAMQLNRR